jgi:microcystin-dependent protein
MTLYKWLQASGSNASVDSTINWAEGQAPSTVNDSGRAMMAATAKWRDDITGVNVTGGTGTAYSLSSNQVITSNVNGFTVQFTPGTSNTGAVTLSIDGQTAQPLRFLTGVDLPSGVLISGSLYQATYRSASGEWLLHSFNASIYSIPIGGGIDFWGAAAPNGSFALAQGQAISRTTYATLFSLFGTTYGTGDGSTTFNIPDKVGRVSAMLDGSSARLSSSFFGGNPASLGAHGGLESETLTLAQLPTGITTSGSNTITVTGPSGHTNPFDASLSASTSSGGTPVWAGGVASSGSYSGTNTITATSNNTSGNAHNVVQPTIICNYIIRVI